ncbi:hypothetical protein CFC21_000446, partial [Triticum aestivum]
RARALLGGTHGHPALTRRHPRPRLDRAGDAARYRPPGRRPPGGLQLCARGARGRHLRDLECWRSVGCAAAGGVRRGGGEEEWLGQ